MGVMALLVGFSKASLLGSPILTLSRVSQAGRKGSRSDKVWNACQNPALGIHQERHGHRLDFKKLGHCGDERHIELLLDPVLEFGSHQGVWIGHAIHLLAGASAGGDEIEQKAAAALLGPSEEGAQVRWQQGGVDALEDGPNGGGIGQLVGLIAQPAHDGEDPSGGDAARVVADVKTLGGDVELHREDAWRPFQGLLNPIGSAQSGDARGLDEACHPQRDRGRIGCRAGSGPGACAGEEKGDQEGLGGHGGGA